MVGSPYPFVREEITFASRAFVSSNREGIIQDPYNIFGIFSMLVKFDSTLFSLLFFFLKGEELVRIFLFPFDDFAIELINTARKRIWKLP